jgi:hypothetical protein
LILSLHVPKTGGSSFRESLRNCYGSRALFDYGDLVGVNTPEAIAHRERRTAKARARKDDLASRYDVIHGHFLPEKYFGLFPVEGFSAFFRDPFQQTLSHYDFFQRHPEIDHPVVKLVHAVQMSLPEFIEAFPDPQTRFLGGLGIDDLAVVGPMEQYERLVALFNSVFGCRIAPSSTRENANPGRDGAYAVDAQTRKAIERYRGGDIEAYRRACEKFEKLAGRYDI